MKDMLIMSSPPRRPQRSLHEENVAAQREHLLAAACKDFARHGYSRAEIGRIAAEAHVTTGAVYHHFSGKKGLFQATAERIEAEILAQASIVDEANPWLRLRLGFKKLVDFYTAADVHRIIFVEAPEVIGPEAWWEIELRYAYGILNKKGDPKVRAQISDLVAGFFRTLEQS
jgi:AcrR family transcriptional regulator